MRPSFSFPSRFPHVFPSPFLSPSSSSSSLIPASDYDVMLREESEQLAFSFPSLSHCLFVWLFCSSAIDYLSSTLILIDHVIKSRLAALT